MAWLADDADEGLYISKHALGNTFLGATGGADWNVSEDATTSLFNNALNNLWTQEADMLNAGIGPRLKGLCWMQGENDATSTTTADAYATNLANLISTYRQQVGDPSAKVLIARIRDQDPTFIPAAVAAVRAAQVSVADADANAEWFDTDAMPLAADNVHYNSAGMKSLGEAFYTRL
jgi:hypothetical protein